MVPDPVAQDPPALAVIRPWVTFIAKTVGYFLGCALIAYMVYGEVRANVVPPAYLVGGVGLLVGGNIMGPALGPALSSAAKSVASLFRGNKGA